VKWNDDILEEDDVFVSEWDCKSTDDTCKNVEKFSCTIKFVSFMDKSEKTLVNSLSNHLSPWNQLSIEFMKDVFQIVSLHGLFRIE